MDIFGYIMKSDSLSNKVYEELRRKILSNQFPANTRLKEDGWAKKLEVSRIAVREALTRLLGERLVRTGEKGGYFVAALTETDVRQLRELREILELGALRLAIQRVKKDDLDKLEKICNDFTGMVNSGYLNGAMEADMKFHETLMECSGNAKLLEAYQASRIPLFHQKLGQVQRPADDYLLTDQEHRQVVKALKAKNLALAEETLVKHFARGEAYVLDEE
jgi:DNA-binding GntR family transcriptional regulator